MLAYYMAIGGRSQKEGGGEKGRVAKSKIKKL